MTETFLLTMVLVHFVAWKLPG